MEYDAPGHVPVDFNKARCVDFNSAHHLKATLHEPGPGPTLSGVAAMGPAWVRPRQYNGQHNREFNRQ